MISAKKQLKTDDIMNPKILDQVKQDLIARKEQILKDLEEISGGEDGQKVKFPEYGDKSDENAQETSEYSTNLATEKVIKSTLRDIENTLSRIEKGTYGICKYCKQEIGEKRL